MENVFLYDFATKTAQKPDTVATYIRRNEKIFKNHVERREKQLWLDEKAVKILLKKYPEVQRKMRILPVIFLARTSVLHFA